MFFTNNTHPIEANFEHLHEITSPPFYKNQEPSLNLQTVDQKVNEYTREDALIFAGTGHGWGASGAASNEYVQAMDFTTDFLFPLLPCNNTTAIAEAVLTMAAMPPEVNMLDTTVLPIGQLYIGRG